MERSEPTPQEVLGQLYRCCVEDCKDSCRFGCVGWLHNFDPPKDETPKEPATDT
jgi:hypothetical protein